MRLKSEIWVSAYVRRANGAGAMVMIARRGDRDGGAIFIKVVAPAPFGQEREADLYVPAPAGLEGAIDRQWVVHASANRAERAIDDYLERQARFDSDLWIIEVEDGQRRHFLEGWLIAA